MLTTALIHPPLLHALGAAGHGSTVLLADGHFPHSTGAQPHVPVIHLNVRPGLLTVDDVLTPLLQCVAVESATVMVPDETLSGAVEPAAVAGYRAQFPAETPLRAVGRFDFYDTCRERDLAAVVATGDVRTYANLLLTLGVADVPC